MPETIGVDLGGTMMRVGVLDSEQQVLYTSSSPSAGLGQDELLSTLERELRKAREARPDVAAAGLGIPCTIDRQRGRAIMAVNLELADVPIRDLMTERLGIPVALDNDANLAMLAEHRFGVAKGARNAAMLTVGTGIGGGLVLDGRLYRGSTGAAAELGHIVIEADGPRCQGNCPNRGCVESLASGTAIAREGVAAAERSPDSALGRVLAAGEALDGRLVTDAALAGDETARDVLALAGRRIGVALSSIANALDPEVLVIGGGVIRAGELLVGPARSELRARALAPMNEARVAAAELGPEAGMIGAATMALLELEAAA
ncbi:MAG TPA: ROK family protein [Solirubrobacterales bacterium]|jgi:glucokinase